jgi:hypothetical protein
MERTADILESIITRSSFREKDTANVR